MNIPDNVLLRIIEEYTADEAAEVIRAINGFDSGPHVCAPETPLGWPEAFSRCVAWVCIALAVFFYLNNPG